MDHGPLHADRALGTPRRIAVGAVILTVSIVVSLFAVLILAFESIAAGFTIFAVQLLVAAGLRWWAAARYESRHAPVVRVAAGALGIPAALILILIVVRLLTT